MSASLLLLLSLAVGPCQDVFDRTNDCSAPDEVLLEKATEPLPSAPQASDAVDASVLAPRLFAASGVVGTFSAAAAVATLWYGAHLAALDKAGRLEPDVEVELRQYQSVASTLAAGLLLGTGLLAGAGTAFLVFDPERGTLVEGFPPIEE